MREKRKGDAILGCTSYGPDPAIIAGFPSGMLEMERTLRDWTVQLLFCR